MKRITSSLALTLVLLSALGCETTRDVFGFADAGPESPIVQRPDRIQWQPATMLPPGAQLAVVEGDPQESGYFALRFRMPDGYHIPPHWHTTAERITILKGTAMLGMGETVDEQGMQELPTGTYAAMPPGMRHYLTVEGDTIVQITTLGPWEIHYVDPHDDPRNITP